MKAEESLSREKPLVSVIVPVYNVERFLDRAVASMLHQSYTNWEMILVDDGSPDRSGEMCDGYAAQDGRIRVIHQENQGQSGARNTGLTVCRGDYLYFLDSDDYIAPNTLETLLHYALPKDADIVIHGHYTVKVGQTEDAVDWSYSEDAEALRDAILLDHLPNFACAKLFRRSLWEGVRFPQGLLMEDMYVMPLLFYKAQKIVLVTDPLYYYCENSGSTMNSVDIASYVRVRYGKFLAWKEHAEKAHRYRSSLERPCTANALHSALRTYTMTGGMDVLSASDREKVRSYIASCDTAGLSLGLRWGCALVLHGPSWLLSCAGRFQRAIVSYQQKRRQSKQQKVVCKK